MTVTVGDARPTGARDYKIKIAHTLKLQSWYIGALTTLKSPNCHKWAQSAAETCACHHSHSVQGVRSKIIYGQTPWRALVVILP